MKKIVLAAALAALAIPAFAQSSVTLWGRINTSVESQKTGSADRVVKLQNNSSRLGVRGTEDLGGGLKAAFNLEHGFNSDTGSLQTFGSPANTFWSRQANVELSGSFGTVRLGTWFPDSYFSTVDRTSNHNHDTGTSSDALFSDFALGRRTNKVGYFSPVIEGFSFIASVHAGEVLPTTAVLSTCPPTTRSTACTLALPTLAQMPSALSPSARLTVWKPTTVSAPSS